MFDISQLWDETKGNQLTMQGWINRIAHMLV